MTRATLILGSLACIAGCGRRDDPAREYVNATRQQIIERTERLFRAVAADSFTAMSALASSDSVASEIRAGALSEKARFRAAAAGLSVRSLELAPCRARLQFTFGYQGRKEGGVVDAEYKDGEWRISRVRVPVEFQ